MNRLVILLIIILAFPSFGHAQRKRALMVGISNYHSCGYKVWNDIHGAEDVALLTPELEKKGFKVLALTNEQTTCQGILQALEHFIVETRKGDVVYLHFSCHGQPAEDGMMGDEKDEADRWDETLVPIDAGKQYDAAGYRGERHITDDLLFKYLFRIRQEIGPKGTLFTIVDACHAGDVERDDDFQTIRGTNEGLTPNCKNKYNPPKQAARKRIMSSPELAPVLYVEACESYQRNQEVTYQRQEYGALSFNVWQTLKQQRVFPANIHAFEDALSKNIQRNKDEHNYLWPGTQDVVFSKSE